MYPTPLADPLGTIALLAKSHVLLLPFFFFVPFAFLVYPSRRSLAIYIAFAGVTLALIPLCVVGASYRHLLMGCAVLLLLLPVGFDVLRRTWIAPYILTIPAVFVLAGILVKGADYQFPMFEQYSTRLKRVLTGPYYDRKYHLTFRPDAVSWAESHLPADALVVTDPRRLGLLDRDWLSIYPAQQCCVLVAPDMSVDSLHRALLSLGTSHIWVDLRRYRYYPETFPRIEEFLEPWERFIGQQNRFTPLYEDSLNIIYYLEPLLHVGPGTDRAAVHSGR